jgi:hypothetical protein
MTEANQGHDIQQPPFGLDAAILDDLRDKAREVEPGGYEVLAGSGQGIVYRPEGLNIIGLHNPSPEGYVPEDLMPGVYKRGRYEDWGGNNREVVSFLYHKTTANGRLERIERTIILNGVGYGVHPSHVGQEPTWYLVGPEVARIDPITREVMMSVPEKSERIQTKNFSVACITRGPFGEPVLANPA